MGQIVVSEFVSLDGVIEDPAGDEGFRLGGWVGEIEGREKADQVKLDEALGTEALLPGSAGAASSSPRGGRPGVASWRTG